MNKRNYVPFVTGVLLILAALACNTPSPATPTAEIPTATPSGAAEVVNPTATEQTVPTVAATDTPVPDVSGPGGCTLNSGYVSDVTVADNTEFSPGASFVKTWRVRNSGTCAWETGTKLVFISGDPLGGPAAVDVSPVAPDSTSDISVNLVAPSAPGTYKGNWQLQAPDGTRFGAVLYVQIVVPAPVTDTPQPTGTPPPTEEPTTEPITPTLPPACVAADPALKPIWDQVQGLGYDIGCPTAPVTSTQGALQEFWANVEEVNPHLHYRSLMIWRSDNKEIYVIDGEDTNASTGTLYAYTDTWEEGQPNVYPVCQGMTPPDGYQLPIRGFGKVWCYNHLQDPVGWPAEGEEAVTLLVQPTQTGLLMQVSGAHAGYIIALDYRAVRGWTMMVSP